MTAVDFDREEWLDWRRGGIGASDVAGVLGLSPWQSPYSIWASKMSITEDEDPTEAMQMGLALEPAIATMFHARTGLYVVGAQTRCVGRDPWELATLDGFVTESGSSANDSALGGFEAKSTSDSVKSWEEAIPVMYAAQVQWQMWVTGLHHTWLGVFHANWGLRFRVYEVERDEDDIEIIVERCREFWHEYVEPGVAPPTDAHWATTDALRSIRADQGSRVDLEDETIDRVILLRQLKKNAKQLEEKIAGHENAVKAALADCTEGYAGGVPVVSWREQDRTAVDVKALREHEPDVAAKFTTKSPVRVLRLAKVKED